MESHSSMCDLLKWTDQSIECYNLHMQRQTNTKDKKKVVFQFEIVNVTDIATLFERLNQQIAVLPKWSTFESSIPFGFTWIFSNLKMFGPVQDNQPKRKCYEPEEEWRMSVEEKNRYEMVKLCWLGHDAINRTTTVRFHRKASTSINCCLLRFVIPIFINV